MSFRKFAKEKMKYKTFSKMVVRKIKTLNVKFRNSTNRCSSTNKEEWCMMPIASFLKR